MAMADDPRRRADDGGERRAGSGEILARLSRLEAAHQAQDEKLDALILLIGSGKGAIRILAWLGGAIAGALSLLALLRDNLFRGP